jgi:hypothetical protein
VSRSTMAHLSAAIASARLGASGTGKEHRR